MSGAEKLVFALVSVAVSAALEASRNRGMEREQIFRMEQQHVHLSQLRALRRTELADRLSRLESNLAGLQSGLPVNQDMELQNAIASAQGLLMSRDADVDAAEERIVSLERRLAAIRREQDLQAARQSTQQGEMLRLRMEALEQRIAGMEPQIDRNDEREARDDAQRTVASLRELPRNAEDVELDFSLRMATRSVDRLQHIVEQDEDRRREAGKAQRTELEAAESVVSGLGADPTVMRWLPGAVGELQQELTALRSRLATLAPRDTHGLSERMRAAEQDLVSRASAAQIKADQRDYITESIRSTLIEMGFIVSEARPEHAEHPASAMLFSAINDAGRGINVSVPVDGEIIYDIDGWPKHSSAKVGGGTSATCDEAQQVLEEMHERLEKEFEVSTGELTWEGKDPDRILRSADELPQGGTEQDQGRER
ncbi:MAG: hypothetical protein R3F46_07075 [bacterium]